MKNYITLFVLLVLPYRGIAMDSALPLDGEEQNENHEVLDLNKVDLDQKEKEWSTRIEADGDETDVSILEEIIENSNDYIYAGDKRSDPFSEPTDDQLKKAFLIQEARYTQTPSKVVDAKGKEIPIVSILQKYELFKLKVKGIWAGSDGKSKAMIITPENEGVIVEVNDPISAGKVIEIYEDRLAIRQYKYQEDGSRTYDDVNLYLRTPKTVEQGSIVFEAGKGVIFKESKSHEKLLQDIHKPKVTAKNDAVSRDSKNREIEFQGDVQPQSITIRDSVKTDDNQVNMNARNHLNTQGEIPNANEVDIIEPNIVRDATGVMGDGDIPADEVLN